MCCALLRNGYGTSHSVWHGCGAFTSARPVSVGLIDRRSEYVSEMTIEPVRYACEENPTTTSIGLITRDGSLIFMWYACHQDVYPSRIYSVIYRENLVVSTMHIITANITLEFFKFSFISSIFLFSSSNSNSVIQRERVRNAFVCVYYLLVHLQKQITKITFYTCALILRSLLR